MNLDILDPFARNIPQTIQAELEDPGPAQSYLTKCELSQDGSYLATACADGRVLVWDVLTRGVVRELVGHHEQPPITSLSWSVSGRYLLSGSRDWTARVWDLKSATGRHATVTASGAVTCALLHPTRERLLLVLVEHVPTPFLHELAADGASVASVAALQVFPPGETGTLTAAALAPTGDLAVFATSKGVLLVYSLVTDRVVLRRKITGGAAVRGLRFGRAGRELVANCSDRIVRTFGVHLRGQRPLGSNMPLLLAPSLAPAFAERAALEDDWFQPDGAAAIVPLHKLQDLVNRCLFSVCRFSADGEYVVAGGRGKGAHSVYIWQAADGRLVKVLQAGHDGVEDLQWHPTRRGCLVSVAETGVAHIWGVAAEENWSAFAPDFCELNHNVEYDEREDEFDVVVPDEDAAALVNNDEQDALVVVDVVSVGGPGPPGLAELNPHVVASTRVPGAAPVDEFWIPLQLEALGQG